MVRVRGAASVRGGGGCASAPPGRGRAGGGECERSLAPVGQPAFATAADPEGGAGVGGQEVVGPLEARGGEEEEDREEPQYAEAGVGVAPEAVAQREPRGGEEQ